MPVLLRHRRKRSFAWISQADRWFTSHRGWMGRIQWKETDLRRWTVPGNNEQRKAQCGLWTIAFTSPDQMSVACSTNERWDDVHRTYCSIATTHTSAPIALVSVSNVGVDQSNSNNEFCEQQSENKPTIVVDIHGGNTTVLLRSEFIFYFTRK